MRIIAGSLRGRRIIAPTGRQTRPTSDQMRESIFNILAHAPWAAPLEGAIIADIFAGSGALGLEAISRGAEFCLFVETQPKARGAIRQNVESMNLFGCTRLHRHDATKLKIAPSNLRGTFTHIFMDPPYDQGLWRPVLARLKQQDLIADNGVIILEESQDSALNLSGYETLTQKYWGNSQILFLRPH